MFSDDQTGLAIRSHVCLVSLWALLCCGAAMQNSGKKSVVFRGGYDVACEPEINYGQYTLAWHKRMYAVFNFSIQGETEKSYNPDQRKMSCSPDISRKKSWWAFIREPD